MTDTPSTELNRATPGVYIEEIDAFPPAIVGVATSVPLFIGYTEFAGANGSACYNAPQRVTSLVEYERIFGGPPTLAFDVVLATAGSGDFVADYADGGGGPVPRAFELAPVSRAFSLYRQLQLFFANGGNDCRIVSVGSYWSDRLPIARPDPTGWAPRTFAAEDLLAGIDAAGRDADATMIVVPEACQLGQADYAVVAGAMIAQAGTLRDRMAILDVPGCLAATTVADLQACQRDLWQALAPAAAAHLSHAAAYAPALHTVLIDAPEIGLASIALGSAEMVNALLTIEAYRLWADSPRQLATAQSAIAAAFPPPMTGPNTSTLSGDSSGFPAPGAGETIEKWRANLGAMLQNALPLFATIAQRIADRVNLQAPSGAIAGVWVANDQNRGVWHAPGNISLASISAPACALTDADQAGFNTPINGQAIDVIRQFAGRGVVVWGARTLDGNSDDYRYISVRRTVNYLEQSIALGLQGYAFATNDAPTWTAATNAIATFLTGLWQQGGIQGATARDAFSVSCGLGRTMTQQDLLDGNMIVEAYVALIRPAEFVVLRFAQKVGGS